MNTYLFTVPGDPKGQPRARAFHNKALGRTMIYTPGTAEEWKGQIAKAAKDAGMENLAFRGTVGIMCVYFFQRPVGHYRTGKNFHLLRDSAPKRYHAQRPDTDNIRKAVKDTLKTIGAYYDDCQVVMDVDISLWVPDPSHTDISIIFDLGELAWRDLARTFGEESGK